MRTMYVHPPFWKYKIVREIDSMNSSIGIKIITGVFELMLSGPSANSDWRERLQT